ncbi:hypothetical protein ACFLZ5_10770 [Thermodesulfobacteriota bacterium]
MRFRIIIPVFLKVLVCLLCFRSLEIYAEPGKYSGATSREQTFLQQADFFYDHLIKLPESKSKNIFKEYKSAVAKEVDMERLYFTTYQGLIDLLDLAVKESIDVLTLFTLPVLQEKANKAIVLDKDILIQLNKHYNLHGLFLISKHSADDDSKVQMNFLVTGQGKLIIGYDRNAVIKHPDYFFATGRYDYQKLFVMDAKTDDNGNYGIFNIKGLVSPTGNYNWMKGPLNVNIRSLSLVPGSENRKNILVQYDLLGSRNKTVGRIPIERLQKEN